MGGCRNDYRVCSRGDVVILVKIFLVCRLVLPTTPGDGNLYARCEAVITPGAPVEESGGVLVIDYLGTTGEPGMRKS